PRQRPPQQPLRRPAQCLTPERCPTPPRPPRQRRRRQPQARPPRRSPRQQPRARQRPLRQPPRPLRPSSSFPPSLALDLLPRIAFLLNRQDARDLALGELQPRRVLERPRRRLEAEVEQLLPR